MAETPTWAKLMSNGKPKGLRGLLSALLLLLGLAPIGWLHAEAPSNLDAGRLVELLRYRDQFEVAKRASMVGGDLRTIADLGLLVLSPSN